MGEFQSAIEAALTSEDLAQSVDDKAFQLKPSVGTWMMPLPKEIEPLSSCESAPDAETECVELEEAIADMKVHESSSSKTAADVEELPSSSSAADSSSKKKQVHLHEETLVEASTDAKDGRAEAAEKSDADPQ